MPSKDAWLVAGVVGMAASLSIASRGPSLLSPFSMPSALVALYAAYSVPDAILRLAVFAVPALFSSSAFLVWCALALRPSRVSSYSRILLVGSLLLSTCWWVSAWQYGVGHQGPRHTFALAALNALLALGLSALWWIVQQRPTQSRVLLFHASVFAWVFWGAFPWLGAMH
jgi:hypothetical protein